MASPPFMAQQQQWMMVPEAPAQQPSGSSLPPVAPLRQLVHSFQQQPSLRQVYPPQLNQLDGRSHGASPVQVNPSVEVSRHDVDSLHPAFAQAMATKSSRKQLKGSGGMRRAMMIMPKVLLFAFWQQFYAYFSGDPFNAFVSSMISCPRPAPPNCSIGSSWVSPENLHSSALDYSEDDLMNASNGICVPVDKYHSAWSLSDKCMDKDEVLQQTTRINGINGWIACFFGLFAVFIAGQAIDVVGRRPVLMLFLSSNIVVKAILFASTFMSHASFVLALSVQNIIEVAFAAGVEPAMNSMVTDYSRGNEELRGDGFAALGFIMHLADVFAFFAGYPVLKVHMTDYAWFWGPLIVVSLIAFVLFNYIPCSKLEETLDKSAESNKLGLITEEDEEAERTWGNKTCPQKMCHVLKVLFKESIAGFHLVGTDPFLAQIIVLNALVGQAIGGSWNLAGAYLLGWGYEQANASLARPAWHLGLMLGAAFSSPIIRFCGAQTAFGAGLILLALGFGACGMGGPLAEQAEMLFWCGTVGLGSTGQGLLIPSFNALISVRVHDAEQGKLFSFVIVINTICGLAVGQLWPQKFYDARSSGWSKGLPWLASMAVFVAMLLWFLVLCSPICRWRPRKEESDCGEDDSSEGSESEG
eukprot:TRINITY_DN61268_c0_g1_i1.p1 TRINITY_DN61268_c0_g1~~TRINITY_DN61268_c0_g1_i1.p1  ORF type:complete len:663 (+),score=87.50 TRINITY_DN61268_c0_g1_i1:69-1991(+)